jgi:hypothetical protein
MWHPRRYNGNTFRKRPGTRRWPLRPTVDIPRSPPPHGPPRSTRPAWWAREERLLCRRDRRWPASPTGHRMARGRRPLPVSQTRRVFLPPLLPVSPMVAAAGRRTADRLANRGRHSPRQDRKASPRHRRDRKDNPQRRRGLRRSNPSSARLLPRPRRANANGIARSLPQPGGRRSSMPGHHRIS